MKIQTLSLVTPPGCNASCPYCVSKMSVQVNGTFPADPRKMPHYAHYHNNLENATDLADLGGISTVIITGKGEPLLYPQWISMFLEHLDYPFIEIQTNGLLLGEKKGGLEAGDQEIWGYMDKWYDTGATHVAISVAHFLPERNKEIYTPNSDYIDLPEVIEQLHEIGYTVRLNCIMLRGWIDDWEDVRDFIFWANDNHVDQLSFRNVAYPDKSADEEVVQWACQHIVENADINVIYEFIRNYGKRLLRLPHGAEIYDVNGQNVCITDCLTTDEAPDQLRQIILMPDGRLTYSWQYEGAVLLR